MREGEQKLYPAVTALTAVNVVIFFAGLIIRPLGDLFYAKGILDSSALFLGNEWYRLITSMFLHADMNHLVSNMLVLFFAGGDVEKRTGTFSFVILYLLTGLCGNLLSVLNSVRLSERHLSLGASGAVFGMLGALAVFTFLNRKNLQRGSLMRLGFGIALSLYAGSVNPAVDQTAHIGGFISGIIYAAAVSLIPGKSSLQNGDHDQLYR